MTSPDLIISRASTSIGDGDGPAYNLGDLDKLPAEIRNEIYKFCLATEEPLIIARARHGAGVCKRHQGCVRIAHSKQFCLIFTTLTVPKRTKKVPTPAGKVIPGALLRASKAVQKESTPILYRDNCFEFDTTRVLYDFFRTFTITAPLLADIKLHHVFNHGEDLDVLGNVEDPKRLFTSSTLHITSADTREKQYHVRKVWGLFKPFIQQLPARRGSKGGRKQIASIDMQLQRLEAIQFHLSDGTSTSNGEKGNVQTKKEQEHVREFRELMVQNINKDASEAMKKETK